MNVFIISLVISTVCAVAVLTSRIWMTARAIVIIAIVASSLYSFTLIKEYEGAPVMVSSLPPVVTVYGSIVDQDSKLIYMLITPQFTELPATYVVTEYQKPLHKALAEGKGKHKGKPFKMTTEKKGDGEEVAGKEGRKDGVGKSVSLESAAFGVFDMPPPVMADKEH